MRKIHTDTRNGTKGASYLQIYSDLCTKGRKAKVKRGVESNLSCIIAFFKNLNQSYRGRAGSVLGHPRVPDRSSWAQARGSQIQAEYEEIFS